MSSFNSFRLYPREIRTFFIPTMTSSSVACASALRSCSLVLHEQSFQHKQFDSYARYAVDLLRTAFAKNS